MSKVLTTNEKLGKEIGNWIDEINSFSNAKAEDVLKFTIDVFNEEKEELVESIRELKVYTDDSIKKELYNRLETLNTMIDMNTRLLSVLLKEE